MDVLEQFKIQILHQVVWVYKKLEDGLVYYHAEFFLNEKCYVEAKGPDLKIVKKLMRTGMKGELEKLQAKLPGKAPASTMDQKLDSADELKPYAP